MRYYLRYIKRLLINTWWQVRGITIKNPALPKKVSSIVFICKGNICRSAVAHYLSSHIIQKDGNPNSLHIYSAGLEARTGTASPDMAVQVAKQFEINLTAHRSVVLTTDLADTADMIVAMEQRQVDAIRKKYPHKKEYVYLLPLFENGWRKNYSGVNRYTILDPYGKSERDYLNSFNRVSRCVKGLLRQIDTRTTKL